MESRKFNEVELLALEGIVKYWDGQYSQDSNGAMQVALQIAAGLRPEETQLIKENESLLRDFFEYVNGGPTPDFAVIQIPSEGNMPNYKVRIVQNRALLTKEINKLRTEVWKTKPIGQMTGLEFKSLLLDILQQAKTSEKAK